MQLVVDVGNTETVVGLVTLDRTMAAHWRVSSVVPRTADELSALMRTFLELDGFDPDGIRAGVVGSVVPASTTLWQETLGRLLVGPVVVVGPSSPLPIRLDVEEPLTVGADRIVNTLAACELYGRDTIAVDLGTATTFDCISADGVFLGGVIAPGLPAGLEWLSGKTAKLPRVQFIPPARVIGRRTETCIQSGVFWQAVDGIDGMVRRIRDEWEKPDAHVVVTGGFAGELGPHLATADRIEPHLTLFGLALAGERLVPDGE